MSKSEQQDAVGRNTCKTKHASEQLLYTVNSHYIAVHRLVLLFLSNVVLVTPKFTFYLSKLLHVREKSDAISCYLSICYLVYKKIQGHTWSIKAPLLVKQYTSARKIFQVFLFVLVLVNFISKVRLHKIMCFVADEITSHFPPKGPKIKLKLQYICPFHACMLRGSALLCIDSKAL